MTDEPQWDQPRKDDNYNSRDNEKPRASAWRMTLCPSCPHVHLVLLDKHGYAFADMTIAESQRDYFVNCLDKLLGLKK